MKYYYSTDGDERNAAPHNECFDTYDEALEACRKWVEQYGNRYGVETAEDWMVFEVPED